MNTPGAQLIKGSLIIASPDIDSGIYFRGVIMICEHSATGSFGILINKPLDIDLSNETINMQDVGNSHVQIRAGGPLQPNQIMLLHSSDNGVDNTLQLCDGVYLGGDLTFLQEAINNPDGPALSLCFGYCGWGPSQLEQEFLSGLWFLCPGSARYVFETPPAQLWRLVLREMGGKYATLSMIPDDLSLN